MGAASACCYLSSAYAASPIWRFSRCDSDSLPSSNDLINPFYVLSWRRLRQARKCHRLCLGRAGMRLSALAHSLAIHIQIQIVGVARLCRHLLTAPLAALMIHSEAKETQGDFVFKSSTTAAGNGAKAEAVDGARLENTHKTTLSICLMDFQIFKQLDKHAVARNVIVSTHPSLPPRLACWPRNALGTFTHILNTNKSYQMLFVWFFFSVFLMMPLWMRWCDRKSYESTRLTV